MQIVYIEYILVFFVLIAGYTDLSYGKIPNLLTFPVILIALVLNFVFMGLNGLIISITGLFLGLVILLPFFFIKGIGGGDLKLFAAIGALKGASFLLQSVLFSSLIAAIMSIGILIREKALLKNLRKIYAFFYTLATPGLKVSLPDRKNSYMIPYGLAITIGTLIAFFRNK